MRAAIVPVLTFLLWVVPACKQKEATPSRAETVVGGAHNAETGDEEKNDRTREMDALSFAGGRTGEGQAQGLGPVGLVPMQKAGDRLLEYHVALQYRTTDFMKARALVLSIASRYGFVASSSASSGRSSSLNTEIVVRIDSLYEVLKELDALGDLLSENIRVIDHTENNFAQKLRTDRETLRIVRKGRSAEAGDPTAKNWAERQASLEKSEDAQDLAELERWKIKDRVSWARIAISLEGPAAPDMIEVPPYKKALIGLVNLALFLSYALLWISPLLLIGLLLLWKRRAIAGFFGRG